MYPQKHSTPNTASLYKLVWAVWLITDVFRAIRCQSVAAHGQAHRDITVFKMNTWIRQMGL